MSKSNVEDVGFPTLATKKGSGRECESGEPNSLREAGPAKVSLS